MRDKEGLENEFRTKVKYLSPRMVERVYGLNRKTLANFRSQRKGPSFLKVGKKVLYPVDELEKWIKKHGILIKTSDS
ncbi:hypothetical protein Thein_1502 [Thermodesulfatator indicus DSM 15286]|uniref:Helix-turn-helix domain-containing protein n=1 Tax=Thermodesulfatator indicus (strain DSM 15286 / JCM 11887 / CIR29812) TaxID=667014 RepID=F8AAE3_THEID|nr:helix-turn-helix domain-containing protein [Thermodesulfatator indicus]AEH45363.1 hypothetical protein Thein_1502 [Thermodesulfatator indicus DSM 15286]